MEVSTNILKLIKQFEGFTPVAVHNKGDRSDVFTGGYGTITHPTGQPVQPGDLFSEDYADHCLIYEINQKAKSLNDTLNKYSIHLNQNQFDALACFIYNVGQGTLSPGRSMGDALKSDNIKAIADAFLLYNKGTSYILGIPVKVVLPGLLARREAERALFLS